MTQAEEARIKGTRRLPKQKRGKSLDAVFSRDYDVHWEGGIADRGARLENIEMDQNRRAVQYREVDPCHVIIRTYVMQVLTDDQVRFLSDSIRPLRGDDSRYASKNCQLMPQALRNTDNTHHTRMWPYSAQVYPIKSVRSMPLHRGARYCYWFRF